MNTPFGRARSRWTLDGDQFALDVEVPVSTRCRVELPDGARHELTSGSYRFSCTVDTSVLRIDA